MTPAHDFESIKQQYFLSYDKALRSGIHQLPFNVEEWQHTLSEVQLKVYNDIKSIGTYLYPLYPIGDYFIDFGNPFKKIGIELLYKEREREERLACIEYFKSFGWTVYVLESKYIEPSAEELYNRLNPDAIQTLYEDDNMFEFVKDQKEVNSECLIYYIKHKHFTLEGHETDDY